jgi:hypothetical protein
MKEEIPMELRVEREEGGGGCLGVLLEGGRGRKCSGCRERERERERDIS